MLPALAAIVVLLGAGPAPAAKSPAGQTYESEDLVAPAPGPRWALHTTIPGAPNLRGAFVYARESGGGKAKVDPSSLITFGIDPIPFSKDPEAYVKSGFDRLSEPPLSFKPGKRAAVKMKGSAPAFRIEYTDRDGLRHFTQVAILTPGGGMLIVTLQAANASNFTDDLPALMGFIDGLRLRAPKAPPVPPAPAPN